MYVAEIPNRGCKPTILLRESYRQSGKVKNRTLANLTHLPAAAIDALRRSLRGEKLVGVDDAFQVIKSSAHGHVEAVLTAMNRLNFDAVPGLGKARTLSLIKALVAARILMPSALARIEPGMLTKSDPPRGSGS